VKYILRFINWIFVIGLLFIGIIIAMTLFFAGISLIAAAILISPPMQDFLHKFIHVNYLISTKVIVILMAILLAIYSLKYETEENLFSARTLLYQLYIGEDIEKMTAFSNKETENSKKQEYLVVRTDIFNELQYLYNDNQYQEVVNQSLPYVSFDADIRQLFENAKDKLKKEQIAIVLNKVPLLIKEGKYMEAYYLAEPFEIAEIKELVAKAKKHVDKNFKRLKNWYESGKYSKVIKANIDQVNSDCRIKTLIVQATTAQEIRTRNKKIKQTIKKTSKLINSRKYEQAISFVTESEFFNNPKLLALVKRAKFRLIKAKEKKILKKLRNIPAAKIEANLRGYANLLELFPNNKKYQKKLAYYNQQILELGKTPPLPIKKEEYEKWPFTVSKGNLKCIPPGMVTFTTEGKTYAINELAIATGNYSKIDIILQDGFDMAIIAQKGLDLCSR